jgi:glucose-1-phosphate thymidylyltransferase
MMAVLLCAGYGTRMYPLTRHRPNPLLPVAGRPVLDYLMDQLIALEALQAIHLVTNARFFDDFAIWATRWRQELANRDRRLVLHNDGSTSAENRLGACADLKLVLDRTERGEGFLVAAGDNIFRFDLSPLWSVFRRAAHHRLVALPETDRARLRQTGVPLWGAGDRVRDLVEKPARPPSNWCCPALYFLKPSAFARLATFLPSAGNRDAPGHFIGYLCRRETVNAFRLNATRLDIGDRAGYRRADRLLRSGG